MSSCSGENEEIDLAIEVNINIPISDFNSIAINSSYINDLRIEYGSTYSISAVGPENVISNLIQFNSIDNQLNISDIAEEIKNDPNVRLLISLPDIKALQVEGLVNVHMVNFSLLQNVNFVHNGFGLLSILNSKVDSCKIVISGLGEIDAFGLDASTVTIDHCGIGSAHIFADKLLMGRIKELGDIYYKGNPDLDIDVTGLGSLIDAN